MGVATALGVAPTLSAGRAGVIEFAARSIGLPYRWGGNGPDAYDCSGLVVAAFASIGRSLPRTAQAQFDVSLARVGSEVPGDLVFFGSSTADVSHVGIVLGDGLMIDAPHTGAFVRIEPHDWPDLVGIASPSG
jgi:cell wall-associated NlpC family hydrolase